MSSEALSATIRAMTERNPVEFHNRQLADKFLKFEKDPLGKTERITLCLYLPVFVENEEIILHTNPYSLKSKEYFQTEIVSNTHLVRQSNPEEILQIVSVAKLSPDVSPEYLTTLKGAANIRLLEMEQEIQRVRQQI